MAAKKSSSKPVKSVPTKSASKNNGYVWQDYGTLMLRLALGVTFIMHAQFKYFTLTLPGMAQFLETFHIPGFLAYVVFATESVGAVLLLLGIFSRYASLAILPIMIGATYIHFDAGWAAGKGGYEHVLFLAVALFAQASFGDGKISLASLFKKKR